MTKEQREARELQRQTGERYTACLARVKAMRQEEARKRKVIVTSSDGAAPEE
jgi:hypothetical protein